MANIVKTVRRFAKDVESIVRNAIHIFVKVAEYVMTALVVKDVFVIIAIFAIVVR